MDEGPQQTDEELSEQVGGAEAGDLDVAGLQTPLHETRHSRRRFLLISGAVVAGVAGIVELFRLKGSGADVTGGAAQSVQNLFSSFPINAVERIPTQTWSDWTVKVDGLVDRPLTLDAAAWQALPRFDETADFHCVEG